MRSVCKLLLAGFLSIATLIAAPMFTVTDLGSLAGPDGFSVAAAVNNLGQVTGFSAVGAEMHAFFWDGAQMVDLGTLGGALSFGYGLNNLGHVTGDSDALNGDILAYIWDGTSMQSIGTLGGVYSSGVGINDSGHATGESDLGDTIDSGTGDTIPGETHAYLWNGTTMQDLGTLGGSYSHGHAINAGGWVTGWSEIACGCSRAFIWDGTQMIDLGTLTGGDESYGYAINDAGHVAGYATDSNFDEHAFYWDGTTMHDLGALDGFESRAFGINNAGQIVGSIDGGRGFYWDGTAMWDLNNLLANQPGWYIFDAQSINESGQIAATGIYIDPNAVSSGAPHALLLTPASEVPEPGTWGMMLGGAAVLAFLKRRR
jgi:probable HAF family extracellular repeat protein